MRHEILEEELGYLTTEHGHLTPALVLESATSVTSPIHTLFEWDNEKAGHDFRLWQARKLIRSVKIERPDGQLMPKFISIRVEGERHYEEAKVLVQDFDKWTIVLEETAASLSELENRIESLIQLGDSENRVAVAQTLQTGVRSLREKFEEATGVA